MVKYRCRSASNGEGTIGWIELRVAHELILGTLLHRVQDQILANKSRVNEAYLIRPGIEQHNNLIGGWISILDVFQIHHDQARELMRPSVVKRESRLDLLGGFETE